MEVNFSERSWHRRFYNTTYKTKYESDFKEPANLCPYFWKVVAALVLLPFTWPSYVVDRFTPIYGIGDKIGIGWVFYVTNLLAYAIGRASDLLNIESLWLAWLAGMGVIAGVVVAALILLALIVGSHDAYRAIKSYRAEKETQSLFGSKVKVWREKVCPRITWK